MNRDLSARRRRLTYRLTDVDEHRLLTGSECDLCGVFTLYLVVDHDHNCCTAPTLQKPACGACVRGLLCSGCNVALGRIENGLKRLASRGVSREESLRYRAHAAQRRAAA